MLLFTRPSAASSAALNVFRGVAALLVFFSHWRNMFFVNYARIESPSGLMKAFYFFTSLGHDSVIIFFVLSGYLVGSTALRQVNAGNWSWPTYLFNRSTRLYVVLIPALLLGLLWDWTGLHHFANLWPYVSPWTGVVAIPGAAIVPLVEHSISARAFFGNLFFLQTILVSYFGSNGALWSLANEFWYYLLFPCFVLALHPKRRPLVARVLYLGIASGIVVFVGYQIALYFLVWLMGAALSLLPKLNIPEKQTKFLKFCLPAPLAVMGIISGANLKRFGSASDFLLALACAICLYIVLQDQSRTLAPLYGKASEFLAQSSYTLYLVHQPFLTFVAAGWITFKWIPDSWHLGIGLLLAALVFAYSQIVFFLFESRTETVRRYLQSLRLSAVKTLDQNIVEQLNVR